jgi:hypothetical protein
MSLRIFVKDLQTPYCPHKVIVSIVVQKSTEYIRMSYLENIKQVRKPTEVPCLFQLAYHSTLQAFNNHPKILCTIRTVNHLH